MLEEVVLRSITCMSACLRWIRRDVYLCARARFAHSAELILRET